MATHANPTWGWLKGADIVMEMYQKGELEQVEETAKPPSQKGRVSYCGHGGNQSGIHQLRLVVFPIIYRVSYMPVEGAVVEIPLFIGFHQHPNGGWEWDFSHQQ